MPYRLRFRADMEYVGAGQSSMGVPSAQKSTVVDVTVNQVPGGGAGGALQAADITTLLATLSTDASAQFNAQLATLALWATTGQG
jgi:hypothetical protein